MKLFFFTILNVLLSSIIILAENDMECKFLRECYSLFTLWLTVDEQSEESKLVNNCLKLLSCGHDETRLKYYCPTEISKEMCTPFWMKLKPTVPTKASNITQLSFDVIHSYDYTPWLALLEYRINNTFASIMCGGSLISPDVVLTSARCVDRRIELKNVILGNYDLLCRNKSCFNSISIPVDTTYVHKSFKAKASKDKNILQNDIAIIKLAKKVDYNDYIKPISLPSGPPSNSTNYTVAHWSLAKNSGRGERLLITKAEKLKDVKDACDKNTVANLGSVDEYICVGKKNNDSLDPYIGDYHGPLMGYEVEAGTAVPKLVLYGVLAIFTPCEYKKFPYGCYTRIYNEPMLSWIKQFIE